MRCPFGHIWRCDYSRCKLGGRCAPTNAFYAATADFPSSGMHWVRSVLAWRAFRPTGVLQNAKVLACVQGGPCPCNRGLDHRGVRRFALAAPHPSPSRHGQQRPGVRPAVPVARGVCVCVFCACLGIGNDAHVAFSFSLGPR
jgi:hypothetical protein